MVVVCDDPDREDEGDLCMAAEFITPQAIAFMACQARGLICLALPEERCDELDLPLMVPANHGSDATGFTVSIEAATGVTTGISAADRARTIQVAVDPATRPADLVRPGHVFPLRARTRGVLDAARPDRGRGRPHPPRRAHPRRCAVRGDQRRRHDGARRAAAGVLPQNDLPDRDRRAHRRLRAQPRAGRHAPSRPA